MTHSNWVKLAQLALVPLPAAAQFLPVENRKGNRSKREAGDWAAGTYQQLQDDGDACSEEKMEEAHWRMGGARAAHDAALQLAGPGPLGLLACLCRTVQNCAGLSLAHGSPPGPDPPLCTVALSPTLPAHCLRA